MEWTSRANELSELFAQKSPNEVVQYILDQLKNNDVPAPDAGFFFWIFPPLPFRYRKIESNVSVAFFLPNFEE